MMRVPVVGLALAVAAPALAQPFMILSFNQARSLPCGEGSFSFATGDVHAAAREAVLDPANFGPGGIVTRDAALAPPVAEIDGAALAGADVVVVNALPASLSRCEELLLRDFVEQGGGIVAFSNNASYVLAAVAGVGPLGACGGNGPITVADAAHPVLQGPFGNVSGTLANVYHCRFTDLGPDGTLLLQSDAPVGAAFEIGLGRAFIINDEEWIINAAKCPAAPSWGAKSRMLLLNAVAWVVPGEGFAYDPMNLACDADCDGNCVLDIFDYLCFVNAYNAQQAYADCDGSGGLNLFDFLCYVNLFNAGCPF